MQEHRRCLPIAMAQHVRIPKTEYLTYDGRSSYDRIIVLLGSIGGDWPLSGIKLICSSTGNRKMSSEVRG